MATLLLRFVDFAIELTGARMGNVQLLDEKTGALRIAASRGFESPFLEFFAAVVDQLERRAGAAEPRVPAGLA